MRLRGSVVEYVLGKDGVAGSTPAGGSFYLFNHKVLI